MAEKKQLQDEELEKISGGEIFFRPGIPTIADFIYQLNAVRTITVYPPTYSWPITISVKVVGHGIMHTGTCGFVNGYAMYYKYETVDSNLSDLNGWYDSVPSNELQIYNKVSPEGIQILD